MEAQTIIRYIVQIGFTTVIFLMFVVVAAALWQTYNTSTLISDLVGVSNAKIEYAHSMRDAIRQRQISLTSILATDDPFERDEEALRFYNYASSYRIARESLLTLPMSSTEKEIHTRLTNLTRMAQPLNRHAAELLNDGAPESEIKQAIQLARNAQNELFIALNDLISLQKLFGNGAVASSQATFYNSVWFILAITLVTIIIAFAIAYYVSGFVAEKNRQLTDSNIKLANAYDRAEEATQSKSAFLANMSHEIRTPLSAIIGFTDLLLQGHQTKAVNDDAIQTISRSSKHLLHLINEILDVSKIEAQKISIENIDISLVAILKDIDDILRTSAEVKNLYFEMDFQFPLPETISSDPVRLRQILINICSNAIKFTNKGGVHLKISHDEKQEHIVFDISDTGIGIDVEKISQLFTPFTQEDTSTTREHGGTGLGLYLSRQLAEKMGGSLDVVSKKGAGSTFSITIPTGSPQGVRMLQSMADIPQQANVTATPDLIRLDGLNILLAEDNRDNQRLFSFYLSGSGAKVTVAENGEQAVNKIMQQNFDLALMDMQMPVMAGTEAVSRIRAAGYNLPIIALTANATNQAREECMNAGCDDFVAKPVEISQLFKVLSNHVKPDESRATQWNINPVMDSEQGKRVIKNFIDGLSKVRNDIEQALAGYDIDALKNIFHQLKGVGGGVGFPMITQLANEIEIPLAHGNYTEIRIKINEFHEMCDQIGTS